MNIATIPTIDLRSECCGMPLMFDDGNRLDEPPITVNDASVGWRWARWYCAKCNLQHYTYELCVGLPRQDPEVLWVGFHAAEREQYVRLEHAGVSVLGHEATNAVYEDPLAGCRIRRYQLLAEYTFGPYKRRSLLQRAARDIVGPLLARASSIIEGARLQ